MSFFELRWVCSGVMGIALGACIPNLTGAPCDSDANCPWDQTCVSGHCALGARDSGPSQGGGGGVASGSGGGGVSGGGGGGGGGAGGAGGGAGGAGGGSGGAGGGSGGGGSGGGGSGGAGGGGTGGSGGGSAIRNQVVSGAGRMAGGSFTLDLEVGPPTAKAPASGGGYTLEGSAPVKP
jgi:hypothetical protein